MIGEPDSYIWEHVYLTVFACILTVSCMTSGIQSYSTVSCCICLYRRYFV